MARLTPDGIERYTPQLVSWNGGGFDLPVLNHRALIHGVTAAKYWDWGDDDRDFKFNSYLGRYHTRHLDLMDVLAMYQPRASAGLDAMASRGGIDQPITAYSRQDVCGNVPGRQRLSAGRHEFEIGDLNVGIAVVDQAGACDVDRCA